MKVGDLVRYVDDDENSIGIIINIAHDECYHVRFICGMEMRCLVYSELEVVCK